jgi:hypothetical protein
MIHHVGGEVCALTVIVDEQAFLPTQRVASGPELLNPALFLALHAFGVLQKAD